MPVNAINKHLLFQGNYLYCTVAREQSLCVSKYKTQTPSISVQLSVLYSNHSVQLHMNIQSMHASKFTTQNKFYYSATIYTVQLQGSNHSMPVNALHKIPFITVQLSILYSCKGVITLCQYMHYTKYLPFQCNYLYCTVAREQSLDASNTFYFSATICTVLLQGSNHSMPVTPSISVQLSVLYSCKVAINLCQ